MTDLVIRCMSPEVAFLRRSATTCRIPLPMAKRKCNGWRPRTGFDPLLTSSIFPGADIRERPCSRLLARSSYFFGLAVEPRLGRRTALTFPLLPPPQKNRSPPSDSSPDTPTPGGISSFSRTCPVRGSTRLMSLSSPSQVPCQSSPSIQVTPVTTRLDSMVRRMAPVSASI